MPHSARSEESSPAYWFVTSTVPVGYWLSDKEVKVKVIRRMCAGWRVRSRVGLVLTAGCAGAGSLGASDNEVTVALVSNSQMTDAQEL